MQGSHCGEAAPVLAVPVDSAALASLLPRGDAKSERGSGGLPNPKGLGVSPSGGGSAVLGSPQMEQLPSSRVETTGV
ncbi:hypothetical protein CDG77_08910 [Nostoc sp. 'Peltigera membranacea cyanobiont' 213]|nr:hypothetical protein NPM_6306 [Nostoc sp. 'Peltigera membranacea cyanobiont' N6]OYD96103.1 hypothetical protein CDG77_08910 [Nostoc sp. 'Peltigera membranacea cyanobiont' 213]